MAETMMGSTGMIPVERQRVDLMSRISIRGIGAGLVVLLACQLLLMALGGALKVWSFPNTPVLGMHEHTTWYWVWSFLSFILSSLAGGFVAAVAGRATTLRDGLLQALVTWATVIALDFVPLLLLPNLFAGTTNEFLLGYLVCNLLAACTALAGGFLGARSEQTALVPTRQVLQRPTGRPFGTTEPLPT